MRLPSRFWTLFARQKETVIHVLRLPVALALMAVVLVFVFAQPVPAQVTTACSTTSLCLDKNYLVTGDYVVGGVVFNGSLVNGLAQGTITIPDPMQPNSTRVPDGALIVGAFLLWGEVESTNPGATTGQVGSFNGYPITGQVLGNPKAPTLWASGGCSGNSDGSKTMHMYLADVRPFLPVDANGRVQGNGLFQVGLVDSGSDGHTVPFKLGGSLIIIYRVLSPLVPLNSIVIYDGAVAPNNSGSTFSQPIVGFYQAAAPLVGRPPLPTSPVAKITHIVGNGQPNKSISASLNGMTLPNLYPNLSTITAFPGVYNGWDNVTWDENNSPINTLVRGNDFTETTSVMPGNGSTQKGCVNYGAVILSTTVADSNGDGLPGVWKAPPSGPPGYTDAKFGQFVPLPGANPSAKDIFVEIDYLSNLDGLAGPYKHSHLPKQAALDMVGDAFAKQNIHVHFDVGNIYQSPLPGGPSANCGTPASPVLCDPYIISNPPGTGGNAISESAVVCTDSMMTLCQFPGTPAVGWKEGFLSVKDLATLPNNPNVPLGNFQFGRKDSYRYALFGHALGEPRSFWTSWAGSAANLSNNSLAKLIQIVNTGTSAIVTIQTPQGLVKPGDCPATPVCSSDLNGDRVTVGGALGQRALNGTYHFTIVSSSTDNIGVTTTKFTITTTGVADGTYNFSNEPQLAVLYGGPTSSSGHSDFPGGADIAETFGLWPADDAPGCQADPSVPLNSGQVYCVNQVGHIIGQAGTLLHEMGHTLTLAHGGTFYPHGAITDPHSALAGQQTNNPSGVPTYGVNCNPGLLSSMNYLFQIRGFPDGLFGDLTHPLIDYSRQTLPNLNELALNETTGTGSDLFTNQLAAHFTRWYAPPNALDIQLQNTTGAQFATHHCDGTPILDGAQMVRVNGTTYSAPIDWNNDNTIEVAAISPQDVNFNDNFFNTPSGSNVDSPLAGFNDWLNVDLRQVGSRAHSRGLSSGGDVGDLGGGGDTGDLSGGGDVGDLGGGGDVGDLGGGGEMGDVGGGGDEQDAETACSTADPPVRLTAVQSGHDVLLNWMTPETCQVRQYDIWRAEVIVNQAPKFTHIGTVTTPTPPATTFTDTRVKNMTEYEYFVTDLSLVSNTNKKVQSRPSNVSTVFVSF